MSGFRSLSFRESTCVHRAHLALRMHTFRVEVCVHHNYLNYHSFILLPLSVLLILLTDASWLFFFLSLPPRVRRAGGRLLQTASCWLLGKTRALFRSHQVHRQFMKHLCFGNKSVKKKMEWEAQTGMCQWVNVHLWKLLWVYHPRHDGVKGNDLADRLVGQATLTSG